MSAQDTGGPAFPVDTNTSRTWAVFENAKKPLSETEYVGLINQLQTGLTLRDYFAAKAMQGFASDCEATWKNGRAGMAEDAYEWADAMLKARKK